METILTADVIFPGVIGLIAFWGAAALYQERGSPVGVLILALLAAGLGYAAVNNASPEHYAWAQAQAADRAAKEKAERQPHVVREADGCKVYAFKSDAGYHYFTRCPDSTATTDSPYQVCTGSGKTRSCTTKYESVVAGQ